MFGLGSPALELVLDGACIRFKTESDFEFALSGRTSIPSEKISRLVSMSDAELLREAEGIRKLEKKFTEILSTAMQASRGIGTVLKTLDMSLVTQDNDWRPIIDALNRQDERFENHKRIALIKYMQYLRARQDVIRTLFAHRQKNRAEASSEVQAIGEKLRETLIFDLSDAIDDVTEQNGMRRLPKGETVEFKIAPGQTMTVKMVRHQCSITNRDGLVFTDDTDNRTPMPAGRYSVGRDGGCEIPLHPDYREISRKHLIIEVVGSDTLKLTDVSSLGTFAPSDLMA